MENRAPAGNPLIDELEAAFARAVLGSLADLPFSMGFEKTIAVLKGSRTRQILEYQLHDYRWFGVFSMFTADQLHSVLESLLNAGLLAIEQVSEFRPVLRITTRGREYLHGHYHVHIASGLFAPAQLPAMDLDARERFARLRKLRNAIALADDVAPYVICTDAMLMDLAAKAPTEREQLYDILGLSERFIESYGERFVREIASTNRRAGEAQ